MDEIEATDSNSLGRFIRRKREEMGISLREFSRQTGIALVFLSDIERGKKKGAAETHTKIAEFLRVPIGELIEVSPHVALCYFRILLDQNPSLRRAFSSFMRRVSDQELTASELANFFKAENRKMHRQGSTNSHHNGSRGLRHVRSAR